MAREIKFKVSFADNPFWLTKVSGPDLDEIHKYCKEHKLEIMETNQFGNKFSVHALKPNAKMRILRKRVEEIPGWKLISDTPTPKMHWLIYERVQEQE